MAIWTALTRANYVSLVKAYLNEDRSDTANELFPDSDIINALNAAQCDIARILGSTGPFFRKTTSVDMTTGNISFPSDYLGGLSAQLITGASDLDRRPLEIVYADDLDSREPYWRGLVATTYPWRLVAQFQSTGFTLYANPQPTATITNGIFFNYIVNPTTMALDADTSPVMTLFPELQMTMLPFAALRVLTLFEGGEADDQYKKYDGLFDRDIKRARMVINTAFAARNTYSPGRS